MVATSGGGGRGVGRSELPVSSTVRLPTGRNEGLPLNFRLAYVVSVVPL